MVAVEQADKPLPLSGPAQFILLAHVLLRMDYFAEAKVGEDYVSMEVQQDVLQFEVPVDNPQLSEVEEEQMVAHMSHSCRQAHMHARFSHSYIHPISITLYPTYKIPA